MRGSRKNENGEQCKVLVIKPFSFKELGQITGTLTILDPTTTKHITVETNLKGTFAQGWV